MLYKFKDRFKRARFNFNTRALLRTPPVVLDAGSSLHVLSLLQHKDLFMYLAAIKSFAKHVPVRQVHVVNDGSLSLSDQQILIYHVPGIVIHGIDQFRGQAVPRGGCWERLVAVAEFSKDAYVIQLDADTLTLGPLPEVVEAVHSRCSFTIGTWDGQQIEPILERARIAKTVLRQGNEHIQVKAEAVFDQLPGAGKMFYVRGCAGFSGFAPSGERLAFIRHISSEMGGILGLQWSQWGSEQVMSNLVVANDLGAIVLPHPIYCDCSKVQVGVTQFIHFIGECRFDGGRYAEMIQDLDLSSGRSRQ